MSRHKLNDLFQRARGGDREAGGELAAWLDVLSQRITAGDKQAHEELFAAVYQITCDAVSNHLKNGFEYLKDRHSVGSVVNQAWLGLFDKDNRPPADLHDLCNLLAWKVRFVLIDIVRRQRKWDRRHGGSEACGDLAQIAVGSDRSGGAAVRKRDFHEAVMLLPDSCREVFALSFYLGFSRQALASMLDWSEYAVRDALLDARTRLGAALRDAE